MNKKKSFLIFLIILIPIIIFAWIFISIGKAIFSIDFNQFIPEYNEGSNNEIDNEIDIERNNNIEAKIYTKEELKVLLKNKIKEKNYSELASTFIMDLFERLYVTYPKWQQAYKDLPDISLFIVDNLINPLTYLESIELYPDGSEESKEIAKIGLGYTESGEDEKLHIKLIYDPYKKSSEEKHLSNLEALFHEIIHGKQMGYQIKLNEDTLTPKSETLFSVFIEGGATYNSRFASEYDAPPKTSIGFCNSSEKTCINYDKESGNGVDYILYMYAYEKMSYFLGYDTMNQLEQGLISEDKIDYLLKQKTGEDILTIISLACNTDDKDSALENLIKLEKIFLEDIKKDINNLDSYEKVKKYIDVYHNFKMKSFPKYGSKELIYKDKDDKFNSYFDIDSLDNLLVDKIIKYKVFNTFSSNNDLNRMAIKTLLNGNKYRYFEFNNIYESIQLPFHIDKVKYYYEEKGSNASLILTYPSKDECLVDYKGTVYLKIAFNKNKITSIKGVDPKKYANKKYKSVFNK